MAMSFSSPVGLLFSVSNCNVMLMVARKTGEGGQGALDYTLIRKFFEEQAMMY